MDFKDVLIKQGLDLGKVMMMRHRPKQPNLRKILPWLAAERPDVFNAYQQTQNPQAERALTKADFVASFIAQEGDKALFVGLYRRRGSRPVTAGQFWAIPEVSEMKRWGLSGPAKGRKTTLWFDLQLMELYSEWKGRLVVKWPRGRLWWRWARNNDFPIHAIHEESLLDAEMPPWNRLSLTTEELRLLPTKWKTVLSQWRGIYYVFDVKVEKGYVGSAYGKENILGRWLGYAASGHCGNKKLKQRNPKDFRFTILQRTSPDMEQAEVVQLEESWKIRLHTREHGLNDN